MDSSPRSVDASSPQQLQQPPPVPEPEPTRDSPAAKRRKRDSADLRQRVTRACDRCKTRKVRCTGVRPCEHCVAAGRSCTYELSYARGRLPPIPSIPSPVPTEPSDILRDAARDDPQQPPAERLSFLSAAAAEMDRRPGDVVAPFSLPLPLPLPLPLSAAPAASALPPVTAAASSRVSPEPSQTDLQGHYVGPASGVSFLLRVQKRLHDNVSFSQQQSSSSIFTFGDAPLPAHGSGSDHGDAGGPFLLLLTQPEASRLLARYFDFAVPTHRFLHRPTVEAWLATFYETRGRMTAGGGSSSREDGRAQAAVLFMVFAQARDYLPVAADTADTDADADAMDSSAQYYRAAERQLAQEKGAVRLASVQARLCQCFYLLAQSRINHCWSLFGTTAHLALAIGLNRNRRADPAGGLGFVDVECRRRTFWCAYSLDNYLSAALGRPRTFHDEDIDQELPSMADDADIVYTEIRRSTSLRLQRAQPVMLAPVAHVRLSRIVGRILRDLYAIRPISSAARAARTAQHTAALAAWRRGDESGEGGGQLARFLDADPASASLLIPIFQRQRNVLNLAYWHALLLTHRPLLLSNFAYLRGGGGSGSGSGGSGAGGGGGSSSFSSSRTDEARAQAQDSMRQCLDAAMHIIAIVDDLFQGGQLFRAYWFTMYFAFSAVVVVYVYVIQHHQDQHRRGDEAAAAAASSPATYYGAYLAAAVACQGQIARLAEAGSLTQRYSLVLEELRLVTLQQTEGGGGGRGGAGQGDGGGVAIYDTSLPSDIPGMDGQQQHAQPPPSQPPALDLTGVPLASSGLTGGLVSGLAGGLADWNGSPSSSLADVTSWGYFDSMVSSGFWPLDSLLHDDHLRG